LDETLMTRIDIDHDEHLGHSGSMVVIKTG